MTNDVCNSMSLRPDQLRSRSPATSADGTTRRNLEHRGSLDEQLKKSKPYRRYAAGVERALGLFDTALQEWADYIAFLSRLQKALQAQPEGIHVIPDKQTVAKRLAQCLNPALPSGVHQKTLEVYALVFALQGRDGLSHDLALYLPGFSSTLTFASLTVRPLFLSLVEDHILRLPVNILRPALKAVILSLLPGLEEETSEDFDRVLDVLNKLKSLFTTAGSAGIFWQCLFLASVTSPSRRLGVLAYLIRYLPRLGPSTSKPENRTANATADATLTVTDPEPGLLIRCFATGLSDKQILVQRTFLDLLVTHLPLNASFYKEQVVREDFMILVTAAASVVLRRDMSLNRRLWSWFLGSESQGDPNGHSVPTSPEESNKQMGQPMEVSNLQGGQQYFDSYGLAILVASLQGMVARSSSSPSERAQPLRIALSLMDRWEIGGPVAVAIFLPLLRSVKQYEDDTPSVEAFNEVLRSANVFFDGVESSLIWAQILRLVDQQSLETRREEQVREDLQLARYIITKFNVQEDEMISVHIPLLLLALLCVQQMLGSQIGACREEIMGLAQSLAVLVTDRAFMAKSTGQGPTRPSASEALQRIHSFYSDVSGSLSLPQLPFTPAELGELILRFSATLLISYLTIGTDNHLESMTQVMTTVASKTSNSTAFAEVSQETLERLELVLKRIQLDEASTLSSPTSAWRLVSCASSITVAICSSQPAAVSEGHLFALVPQLVGYLWAPLGPTTPQHHIEAVRQIWNLQNVSSLHRLVESTITSLMVSAGFEPLTSAAIEIERFAVLWNHSATLGSLTSSGSSMLDGPLLLVLDYLGSQNADISSACKNWLQSTPLPSLARIYQLITAPFVPLVQENELDVTEASSLLQRLSDIISAQSSQQWSWFVLEPLSGHLAEHAAESGSKTWQVFVARMCVQLMNKPEPQKATSMARKALGVLRQLLQGPSGDSLVEQQLEVFLIRKLEHTVDMNDTKLQMDLLEALVVIQSLKLKQSKGHIVNKAARLQHRRLTSREKNGSNAQLPAETESVARDPAEASRIEPSSLLMPCLHKGLTSKHARPNLDKWIVLLSEALPLYTSSIFQILIKLVENLCKEISATFGSMRPLFSSSPTVVNEDLYKSLSHLLSGLEYVLSQAHERLVADETQLATVKTGDQPQGFLVNMVSGAPPHEGNQLRNSMANNRLTVVLCLQDSVRVLVDVWSWEKSGATSPFDRFASFQHASSKLRNRSRRILEHLLEAEPLECLETLIELWIRAAKSDYLPGSPPVLDLFHTLNASRPRFTIPAIFNAIYSRTNPTALNKNQRSTLSSNLSETELASFLVHYASSLEDDILDEIWMDCTTFLRDVLGNPMPHRRILPRLLEFIAVIGQKMENTNFGEESKLRRELGVCMLAYFCSGLLTGGRICSCVSSLPSSL